MEPSAVGTARLGVSHIVHPCHGCPAVPLVCVLEAFLTSMRPPTCSGGGGDQDADIPVWRGGCYRWLPRKHGGPWIPTDLSSWQRQNRAYWSWHVHAGALRGSVPPLHACRFNILATNDAELRYFWRRVLHCPCHSSMLNYVCMVAAGSRYSRWPPFKAVPQQDASAHPPAYAHSYPLIFLHLA